ncbi:MAG: response regulator receiver protein [Promethearchaeota archaeon CR_4]|nr:MAG: response regulator receiver protein [Candidatus Lokiarchaeota archaeon CR_4]
MKSNLTFSVEDNPDELLSNQMTLKKGDLLNDVVVVHDGGESLEYLFNKGKYIERNTSTIPHLILLDLKILQMGDAQALMSI